MSAPGRQNCRICGSARGSFHTAREMMFGTGEEFSYFECARCGCLQVAQYPRDVGRYYGNNYFSFRNIEIGRGAKLAFCLRKKWVDHALGRRTVVGALLGRLRPAPALYDLFRKHDIARDSGILDVGCGNGRFLGTLYRAGFERLTGIDPYIGEDVVFGEGFRLAKRSIFDESGRYDYIAFNHSFEHLPSQRAVLLKARSLLADRGIISLAIPVIGHAWRKYGVDWVQLDAPRHFYLHSRKSLALLAGQAGLSIVDTVYNSDEFQFWGSEQYRQRIPLTADNSYWVDTSRSLFSKKQISAFQDQAREWNAMQEGDQAVFILKAAR
jgi:2-polyprenyl-3-methyl-5-hydroxy-6-metoxy-1,4-benzoquinol methylase